MMLLSITPWVKVKIDFFSLHFSFDQSKFYTFLLLINRPDIDENNNCLIRYFDNI